MRKVSIATAMPGMVLAREVTNESGVTLFAEGTVLNDQFIARLKTINVAILYIQGSPSPKRPMQEELSLLDERFRKSGNTPVMATIKKLMAEHIASLYA